MNSNIKIQYCDKIEKSEYNDLVILGDIIGGNCVKMTQECYEIINDCIGSGKTVDEYLTEYDEESRTYIIKLITLLIAKHIVCDVNNYDNVKCKIHTVHLLLTNRCNLQCLHCSVDAQCCSDCAELSTQEWKSVIDKHAGMDIEEVVFSGGEPMLRSDLLELAKYTKETLDCSLQIMTNGTLITEANIDDLVSVFDTFSISLDGVDEESCSIVRGKGTFTKAMHGIELLKSRGVENLSISFVLIKQNENKTEEFIQLADQLGAQPMIRQFEVKGRAQQNLDLLPSLHKNYFEPALSCDIPESNSFGPANMPSCISCGAFTEKYLINEIGDIYPCQVLVSPEFKVANVMDIESMNEFITTQKIYNTNGYKEFIKIHPAQNEHCSDCSAKLFCTSCLYQTYLMMDRDDMDEICKKKKEGLSIVWN